MHIHIHLHHHDKPADSKLDRILETVIDNNEKLKQIMPTIQELSTKVDDLQTTLDTEQQQVADAIAALNTSVTDLQTTIDQLRNDVAAGGTEADRQAIADKLDGIKADIQSTIADLPTQPEEPTTPETPTEPTV